MDQFIRGVTLISQVCGVFAAALIASVGRSVAGSSDAGL